MAGSTDRRQALHEALLEAVRGTIPLCSDPALLPGATLMLQKLLLLQLMDLQGVSCVPAVRAGAQGLDTDHRR